MALEIDFCLQARIRRDEAADVFVAWCPALNVRSQGTSETEAKNALSSAITMYLTHCYRRNILHNLLHQRGFEPVSADGAARQSGRS